MSLRPVGLVAFWLVGCGAPEPPPAPATVTVVAQGGPLHATNGMYFGPDGRLYVASASSATVAAFDPETGKMLESWGPDHGVRGPDDLFVQTDGTIYWTDFAFGEVRKRTPDGTTTLIAAPGPGVNPITFSDDGRLFVSQCALGHHLFEIDPNGVKKPRLITDKLGPGCGFNGMDWGPDGRLYGPRPPVREVARINVDTGAVETVATGFRGPVALKFDSRRRLHVLDTGAGEVLRVDIKTGAKEVVGRVGVGSDNLAFDARDRLFVSSFTDSYIVEVIGPDKNRTVVAGGLSFPGGVAYLTSGGAGRLFVADRRTLRELDPATGTQVYSSAERASDVGEAMSVHPHRDQLMLTSPTAVRIWDPNSHRLVARFDDFDEAVDALPLGGDIIVSEYNTGSVVRVDAASPKARTVIASGIAEPAGLAAAGGDLYVADRAGSLLQVLQDNKPLNPPRVVATGLAGPEGIAAGEDGSLYVVEVEAGRVVEVDPKTGATTLVADGLTLAGLEQKSIGKNTSVGFLTGIAVGNGSLYVTSYAKNLVYRIDR